MTGWGVHVYTSPLSLRPTDCFPRCLCHLHTWYVLLHAWEWTTRVSFYHRTNAGGWSYSSCHSTCIIFRTLLHGLLQNTSQIYPHRQGDWLLVRVVWQLTVSLFRAGFSQPARWQARAHNSAIILETLFSQVKASSPFCWGEWFGVATNVFYQQYQTRRGKHLASFYTECTDIPPLAVSYLQR